MIGALAGIFITLFGIYGGEYIIERLNLGPRSALAFGWFMGMVFCAVLFVLAKAGAMS